MLHLREYTFSYIKQWMTPKGIVDHLLSIDRILLNTHTVVNELRYALKENNEEAFKKALEKMEMNTISPELQNSVKTIRKYDGLVKNTFDYINLTNGPIEGINNKIKLIQRISYGYRNFENLRNRIILCSNLFEVDSKKRLSNFMLFNL